MKVEISKPRQTRNRRFFEKKAKPVTPEDIARSKERLEECKSGVQLENDETKKSTFVSTEAKEPEPAQEQNAESERTTDPEQTTGIEESEELSSAEEEEEEIEEPTPKRPSISGGCIAVTFICVAGGVAAFMMVQFMASKYLSVLGG